MARIRKGLVIVNTGNGKGKTTAALGLLFRARGHDYRVAAIQFIKSSKRDTGERRAAQLLGFDLVPLGDGFTWLSKDVDHTRQLALDAWEIGKSQIASGEFDVVLLDEFTYALKYGWVDVGEVTAILAARPPDLHVVITGRDAPPELVEAADLVTEMREIKHPYRQGIPAQQGVDF